MLKENTYLSFLGLLLGSIKRLYLNPTKPILYDYPTWLNTILESNYETKQNKKQTHYQNLSSDKRFFLFDILSQMMKFILKVSAYQVQILKNGNLKDLILIFYLFDLFPMRPPYTWGYDFWSKIADLKILNNVT